MANVAVNKVILIGRLTDEPEPPRTLPSSGNQVIKFRLAVGRSRKNPSTGQWESDPNPLYIDCEAFSRGDNTRLIDVIRNYLHRGSQVYIEGRLQLDTWDDKTSGQKRSKHKIVLDELQMLDGRPGEERGDTGEMGGRSGMSNRSAPSQRSSPSSTRSGSGYSSYDDMDAPNPRDSGSDDDIPF